MLHVEMKSRLGMSMLSTAIRGGLLYRGTTAQVPDWLGGGTGGV